MPATPAPRVATFVFRQVDVVWLSLRRELDGAASAGPDNAVHVKASKTTAERCMGSWPKEDQYRNSARLAFHICDFYISRNYLPANKKD